MQYNNDNDKKIYDDGDGDGDDDNDDDKVQLL